MADMRENWRILLFYHDISTQRHDRPRVLILEILEISKQGFVYFMRCLNCFIDFVLNNDVMKTRHISRASSVGLPND